MRQIFECENLNDEHGNPAGGSVHAVGLDIHWQDGPLGRGAERTAPNGTFVETVIAAALQRLEYYQASRFRCDENQIAIERLRTALQALERRTARRENAGIEGTHAGDITEGARQPDGPPPSESGQAPMVVPGGAG